MSAAAGNSLERLLGLLDLFSMDAPVWSTEAMMQATGSTRSTCYRYLKVLQAAGFLTPVAQGAYILGPRIIELDRQLRLRDIGGIIVIDFIDMEIKENRRKVVDSFRSALSRDKTRTQVFEISELGLVEMTRKRIGEGLLTNFADPCVTCEGRGVMIDLSMLD